MPVAVCVAVGGIAPVAAYPPIQVVVIARAVQVVVITCAVQVVVIACAAIVDERSSTPAPVSWAYIVSNGSNCGSCSRNCLRCCRQ
jgi:hypothetical protein